MKNGAAYIRVSTDDQLELSPDSQVRKIREFASARGIALEDESFFMEQEGRSGRRADKRPQFQRMIARAKSPEHPFDVILVWKFSRFARNQEESILYKSMLKRDHVEVLSVSEPLVEGPFGSLIERIIEWMDEYYSIRLSGEVVRGMTEKALRGGLVGSPAFGYRAVDGVLVPHPEEAEAVRFVFDRFLRHGMGCREIATALNRMGFRTKKGGAIESRTVEYILRNPVYIGKVRWSPEGPIDRNWDRPGVILSDGGHEPILPPAVFEAAQRRLAEEKGRFAKFARQTPPKDDYMLRGLVRCSACGGTLVRSGKGLQCHSYAKGACAASHYISLEQANRRVLALMEETLGNAPFPLAAGRAAPVVDERAALEAGIRREQLRLERARAAYESGVDSLEEYRARKEAVGASVAALRAKLPPGPAAGKAPAGRAWGSVADLRGPGLTETEKNKILRAVLDRIVFDRAQNRLAVIFRA